MDPPHHGTSTQSSGKQTQSWDNINKSSSYMPLETGGIARNVLPPLIGASESPHTSPAVPRSAYAMPATPYTSSRVFLPPPENILKSHSLPRTCHVCGRLGCTLVSHKHHVNDTRTKHPSYRVVKHTRQRSSLSRTLAPSRLTETLTQFPIAMDAERQRLLESWSTDWGTTKHGPERHIFPIKWIDLLLPAAIKNAALFQTLLATSASLRALAGRSVDDSGLHHLQLAVQMASQTWNNQNESSSDECILASVLILITYLARGDAYEVERRFSTLIQTVGSRGGLHYLGVSGVIAELLMYADYTRAVFLDREPAFHMLLPPLQVGVASRLGRGFQELKDLGNFSPDLLLAADSLCRSTDIFESPYAGRPTATGPLNSFSYLSSVSEFQLARCNTMFLDSSSWDECMCVALLLFNCMVLRNHGAFDSPSQRLEHRFWLVLDSTIARHGLDSIPPHLLLWILMTGLTPCIYAGREYRLNAVERMKAINKTVGIQGWEQFRTKVLDLHLWMRAAQEETFLDIWLEVEGFKAIPESSER